MIKADSDDSFLMCHSIVFQLVILVLFSGIHLVWQNAREIENEGILLLLKITRCTQLKDVIICSLRAVL